MKYDKEEKSVILDREINKLDRFVLDFIDILEKHTDYVVVSGYVSILFGRSRATEDIDLLVPEINEREFQRLWEKIYGNGFECINTSKEKEAIDMLKEHAIRFARTGQPLPNIEFKKIKNDLDKYSFKNKIKVILNKGKLYISPFEMQIAYKLFLGSEKDLEDAKHLYDIFKEKLNKEELVYLIDKLNVGDKFKIIR